MGYLQLAAAAAVTQHRVLQCVGHGRTRLLPTVQSHPLQNNFCCQIATAVSIGKDNYIKLGKTRGVSPHKAPSSRLVGWLAQASYCLHTWVMYTSI
jgi:hypothetical protein